MKTKKLLKSICLFISFAMLLMVFASCSAYDPGGYRGYYDDDFLQSGDEFTEFTENPFVKASEQPVSYFSMDVSTASYSVLRNYINKGLTLSKDMIKIEEMVNYFKYSYPAPQNGDPLSITSNIFPCPWNNGSLLYSVGLKAKDIEFEEVRNNLVFLIDTSGSMDSEDKLGLLQEAFCILADNLNDTDIVSIVTYAGSSVTALDGAAGSERMRIKNIITDLRAGGMTGGAGGIEHAYTLAEKHFITGGNNRVILATDGDFNVGISSQSDLKEFITSKRSQSKGVYLSIMGFGLGNFKNTTMDTLAQNGNGAAYYIDSPLEAKRVMAEEMKGTLVTVADDVKAGVEFNPDKIEKYRLLGYETKLLTQEDWENNLADAGEIGAGHTVTAVYEIVLKQNALTAASSHATLGNSFVKASVRYKEPYEGDRPATDTRTVQEIFALCDAAEILSDGDFKQNEDLVFITCVIESALIFRNSEHKGTASLTAVLNRLSELPHLQENEYRKDFYNLITKYKSAH